MKIIYRLLLLILALGTLSTSCRKSKCAEGEGDNFEKATNTAAFHSIITEIPANLLLVHDTLLTNGIVEISAQEQVHDRLSVEVEDGVLRIFFNDCLDGHKDISLKIQSANFREIVANSPLKISSQVAIQSDSLRIAVLQSSDADIFFAGDYLETDFLASGTFVLAGRTTHYVCTNEANMELNTYNLIADTVDLQLNTRNSIEVYAHSLLTAVIDGNGDVLYRGFPEIEQSGSGDGQIIEDN